MSGLYCTHIHEEPGFMSMPCTRETDRFYSVRDKNGKEVDFGLCKPCANALCPEGGTIEEEAE